MKKYHMIDVYHVRANCETNANLATLSLAAFPGGGARVGDPLDLDIMHDDENGTTTDYKERMDTATTHATVSATRCRSRRRDFCHQSFRRASWRRAS